MTMETIPHHFAVAKITDNEAADPLDPNFPNLIVTFPKVWEDFVDVQWTRQVFDGRRVLKYHLRAGAKDYHVERYFDAQENSFRLAGLNPNIEVEVQVRAQIETKAQGPVWNAWASNIARTLCSASLEVVTVRKAQLHGRVSWGSDLVENGPTDTHAAIPAAKFQVDIEQRGRILAHQVYRKEFDASHGREIFLDDVDPESTFYLTVRAISIFGDLGKWSTPTRFLTLNPVAMVLKDVAETEATITWSRGEDDDSSTAEGRIEELVVVVEQLPNKKELELDASAPPTRIDAQAFSNEARRYKIRGLLPGNKYLLKSRYRNILGDFTEWNIVPILTLQPVEPVDVQLVGHNFIQVKWSRAVEKDDPVDASWQSVAKWEVRCTVGNASTSTELPPREMETKLMGLLSGVDYSIDVRAITPSGVVGLWNTAITVTTLHRLVPRVTFAGETWLRVAWDRREKRYKDNIERFHVQLSCLTSPFRLAKYFPADTTNYVFENLKPATGYQVQIQAYSDNRWGPWSDPVTIATCASCVAHLVRRGEDFIQLRWTSEYYTRCAVEDRQQKYQLRIRRKRPPQPSEDTLVGVKDKPGNYDTTLATNSSDILDHETVLDLDHCAYRINHVTPFSRVVVQVRAFDYSLQAWYNWGPETEFRTLPSVAVITLVGEAFAEVSWPRTPRLISGITDDQSMKGHADPLEPTAAKQYVLRLNSVLADGTHKEASKYHFDALQATTFTMGDLKPDSLYSVQLTYLDTAGRWSTQSAPVLFRTLPRLQVVVTDIGEGTVALRWGRWAAGKTLLDANTLMQAGGNAESETTYKISVYQIESEEQRVPDPQSEALVPGAPAAASKVIPLQFNVAGQSTYQLTNLQPDTLYRVQLACAPKNTTSWGTWSEPVYVRTTAPMKANLELIGQDYAVLAWQRHEPSETEVLRKLPDSTFQMVHFGAPLEQQMPTPQVDADGAPLGHVVHVGDTSVMEYHVQLFRIDPPADPLIDNALVRTNVYDQKKPQKDNNVRVPGLTPNTPYEAIVRAKCASKEWGVWSTPLQFRTTMPTTVRVMAIEQTGLTVGWGRHEVNGQIGGIVTQGVSEADVDEYELQVEGLDDNFHLLLTLRPDTLSYTLRGLNIGCCYSFSVRAFLISENGWGAWCEKVYATISAVQLELTEASQNWLHLSWTNNAAPDGRPKAQFLTVIGDGVATTISLPGDEKHRVVEGLAPNQLYTAHLLRVEQSPTYARADPIELISVGTKSSRPAATGHGEMLPDVKNVNFSIPLVACDAATYVREGFIVRTHRELELQIERVGQNFVLCRWCPRRAPGEEDLPIHLGSELFEVETATINSDEKPRTLRAQGQHVYVRQLKPDSTVTCRVRSVARQTDATCAWSNNVTARLLPMIDPVLGTGENTDIPGIGEDYLTVHWSTALSDFPPEALLGVSFEVRVIPLEGPYAHTESAFETKPPRYHFSGLQPDTKYQIQVRTLIGGRGGSAMPDSEVARGEWSQPLICTTLSPMAVAITNIAESTAVIHWRRRNCAIGNNWWEGISNEERIAEIATISSFHVRVADRDGNGPPVYDEQFGDQYAEFQQCRTRLRGLSPGVVYLVSVRASTGTLWGGWSFPSQFRTQLPVVAKANCVGEAYVFMGWERPEVKHCGKIEQALPRLTNMISSHTQEAGDSSPQAAASATSTAAQYFTPEKIASQPPSIARLAKPLEWELSFKAVSGQPGSGPPGSTGPGAMVVSVDAAHFVQCVGSLGANTPYTACVRAKYNEEDGFGPWSEPAYFVTIPELDVEVSKVGENFCQVSWKRGNQAHIGTKMRLRHLEAEKLLDAQIRDLEEQRDSLLTMLANRERDAESGSRGGDKPSYTQPVGMDAGDGESSLGATVPQTEEHRQTAADVGAEDADDEPSLEAKIRLVEASIIHMQARAKQEKELVQLKIAELERSTTYARTSEADDVSYELVVRHIRKAIPNADGIVPPISDSETGYTLITKKVGRGEMSYRIKNKLVQQTMYSVEVRALHINQSHASLLDVGRSEVQDIDEATGIPWGRWGQRTCFTTLKPISIAARGVGSECFAVQWDTGLGESKASSQTAISMFQIELTEVTRGTLRKIQVEDPSLKSYVVPGLTANSTYEVAVKVCYEGDKWGDLSESLRFTTLPMLTARLQRTAEKSVEFLVWREASKDPSSYQGQPISKHQLAINGVPCADTFMMEQGTSTLLTLDALQLDSEYTISVRDEVDEVWQDYHTVLVCETLPHVPMRPTLLERKGIHVAIAWQHRRNLPEKQYLYGVEVALIEDVAVGGKSQAGSSKRAVQAARGSRGPGGSSPAVGSAVTASRMANHGPFLELGFTTAQEFRLEMPYPIHACIFRVKVCKTNMTVDGIPLPVQLPPGSSPQQVQVENPMLYLWSATTPNANFKTPSVPDHPTGIQVRNLTHTHAFLVWQKPANHAEHCNMMYRVYLNNSYADKFTCIAETTETHFRLDDLVPNTHYRVSVTAESTMGRSVNNNTLHFSTRTAPVDGQLVVPQHKPMTSTLPPRTVLKPPKGFSREAAEKERGNSPDFIGDPLLDDAASTLYAIGHSRRSPTRRHGDPVEDAPKLQSVTSHPIPQDK